MSCVCTACTYVRICRVSRTALAAQAMARTDFWSDPYFQDFNKPASYVSTQSTYKARHAAILIKGGYLSTGTVVLHFSESFSPLECDTCTARQHHLKLLMTTHLV